MGWVVSNPLCVVQYSEHVVSDCYTSFDIHIEDLVERTLIAFALWHLPIVVGHCARHTNLAIEEWSFLWA